MTDKLTMLIRREAEGGRLSCSSAWQIAGELGITKKEVGEACDELKVKIHSCQLGCF